MSSCGNSVQFKKKNFSAKKDSNKEKPNHNNPVMFQVSAVFFHCTSVSTLGRRRVVYSDWQHLCVISVYRDLRPELTWTLQKVERGSGGQQGKVDTNQGNYRPIALTSSIYKMMEQMINQSGFRRGRNSRDLVLCLEHKVRKAQIKRVVAVFFCFFFI